jgi:hypothetical protein
MVKYTTTLNFIRICSKKDNARYNAFSKSIDLDKQVIFQYRNDVEKILDFVKKIDTLSHKFDEYDRRNETFLAQIFHTFIVSDLRAMTILLVNGQQNQSNMILRHLIENLIYSLWADLISRFSKITDYLILLQPEEWKRYKNTQKILWNPDEKNYPQRSIRERLERIRLINFERKKGKEFYKKYFRKATMCDILILLSLPVCSSCMQNPELSAKIDYRKYHIQKSLRKQGKEDEHAYYKTDFGTHCSFCKRVKLTEGFALGIPDFDNMIQMLAEAVVQDYKVSEKLRSINQVYSYLSSYFIHFSTAALPETKPEPYNTTSGKATLWGFEGINFCIHIIEPILDYYFKELTKKPRREV